MLKLRISITFFILVFSLASCAGKYPMKKLSISIPTPWGAIPINLEWEAKRAVHAEKDLKQRPEFTKDKGEYKTFENLGFAIWVPPNYADYRSGQHFSLRPEYSKLLKKSIMSSINREEEKFGSLAVDTLISKALLEAQSRRYTYGGEIMMNFTPGAILNGWKVTPEAFQEMKKIGEESMSLPYRNIIITSVSKGKTFPEEFLSNTPNLILWSSRRFDMAFNVKGVYNLTGISDYKNDEFTYLRYNWTFKNVEVDGKPDQSVVLEGLRAYFEGDKFLYLIDIFALEGYTNNKEWKELENALKSFKFLRKS